MPFESTDRQRNTQFSFRFLTTCSTSSNRKSRVNDGKERFCRTRSPTPAGVLGISVDRGQRHFSRDHTSILRFNPTVEFTHYCIRKVKTIDQLKPENIVS